VESGGEVGGKLVHFDGPLAFTADDLLCATAEILGKSTYGTVYKATLEDGSLVAVKRLREKITKGHKEFEAEAAVLGRIRHPNLLALTAYYLGPKGEKLLVFDFMPKGNLSTFLHGQTSYTYSSVSCSVQHY
jgi:serine/threonine protein kinase